MGSFTRKLRKAEDAREDVERRAQWQRDQQARQLERDRQRETIAMRQLQIEEERAVIMKGRSVGYSMAEAAARQIAHEVRLWDEPAASFTTHAEGAYRARMNLEARAVAVLGSDGPAPPTIEPKVRPGGATRLLLGMTAAIVAVCSARDR